MQERDQQMKLHRGSYTTRDGDIDAVYAQSADGQGDILLAEGRTGESTPVVAGQALKEAREVLVVDNVDCSDCHDDESGLTLELDRDEAGPDSPPCRFMRSYNARTRLDLQAAGEALSTERLAVLETLALSSGERNDAGADTAIESELEALERLHPVCLRWYSAAAARPDAERGQPRCPNPEPGTGG